MALTFLQQIGKILTRPIFEGTGGRGGSAWLFGPQSNYDYQREAGSLWLSSIPATCLAWERRACVEAEIAIQRRNKNGDWANATRHPALPLLANPNAFFDTHQLMDAVRFCYHVNGNAYLYKSRSASGRVVELWWMPHWTVFPRWEENGTAFISAYEYRVNGHVYALPPEDVIHFRNGIDPAYHGRRGLSTFAAVLREVCTDNEASVIAAALCKNMGIPGVIVSPKQATDKLTKAQRDDFKTMWDESFRGSNAGAPFVQSIPVEITSPGFDLQQLAFEKLKSIPEQRISAAFGLPAVVLGLGTGLVNSNTRAGQADAREQAWESCIIPTLTILARTLTRSLVSEFSDITDTRAWWDLSNVRCLQADEKALYDRLKVATGKPWMTTNEARVAAGLKPLPGGDDLNVRDKKPQGATTDPAADNNGDTE